MKTQTLNLINLKLPLKASIPKDDLEMRTEVAVIGAGPSGLLAARELAERGVNVKVFEEHREIGVPNHCAGLLSLSGLGRLNLKVDEGFVENYVRGAVFFSPSGISFRVESKEAQACVVDRAAFDSHLAELAREAGAEIIKGVRVDDVVVSRELANLQVEGEPIEASFVVDAEGVKSRIVRRVGLKSFDSRGVLRALQYDLMDVDVERDFVEVYLDRRLAPGFFCWVIPTGKNSARVGLAGYNINLRRSLMIFLKRRFEGYAINNARGGLVITSGPIPKTYIGRLAVVGDAAGQVKPTTGGGVIVGGMCARLCGQVIAEALRDGAEGNILSEYEEGWIDSLGEEFRRMKLVRRLLNMLPDRLIDQIFKRIIDAGLHEELSRVGDIDFQSGAFNLLIRNLPKQLLKSLSFLR